MHFNKLCILYIYFLNLLQIKTTNLCLKLTLNIFWDYIVFLDKFFFSMFGKEHMSDRVVFDTQRASINTLDYCLSNIRVSSLRASLRVNELRTCRKDLRSTIYRTCIHRSSSIVVIHGSSLAATFRRIFPLARCHRLRTTLCLHP